MARRLPMLASVVLLVSLLVVSLVPCQCTEDRQCPQTMENHCTCTNETVICTEPSLFTSIPTNLLYVKNLKLNYNNFPIIEKFPHFDSLIKLHLESNQITYIHPLAFKNLTRLQVLSLEYNNLRAGVLTDQTFVGLVSLTELYLNNNPLTIIQPETFVGHYLPKLNVLTLSNCSIVAFQDKAIDSLSNLQILNMSNNQLEKMPVIGCPNHSLRQFNILILSYNRIKKLDGVHCDHMPTLQKLDLSYNAIEAIPAEALKGAEASIQDLNLRGNQISSIAPNVFRNALKLKTLDITYNNLRVLNSATIAWENMTKVLVHDNPWECSCHNVWLIHEYRVSQWELHRLTCASPADVAGYSVFDVEVESAFARGNCGDDRHPLRMAMGILLCISLTILIVIFIYKCVTKRRRRGPMASGQRGTSIGGSPTYRRMASDTDLAFSVNDDRDELTNGSSMLTMGSTPVNSIRFKV